MAVHGNAPGEALLHKVRKGSESSFSSASSNPALMALTNLLSLLLLLAYVELVYSTTCFIPNTSKIRREAINIIPGDSLVLCKFACMADPACTAIQITTTGNCVIFGAEITATVGECPAPFTCLLRMTTGCTPLPRRAIDTGHVADACTGSIVNAPAEDGSLPPCGKYPTVSDRNVFIDALLHDGTNMVLESYERAPLLWDDEVGSWYMQYTTPPGEKYYFLAAKCVRPPVTPISGCECAPLPMDLPPDSGKQIAADVTVEQSLACPDNGINKVQIRFLRPDEWKSINAVYGNFPRRIFCANKVWIQVSEIPSAYTSAVVTNVTCIRP